MAAFHLDMRNVSRAFGADRKPVEDITSTSPTQPEIFPNFMYGICLFLLVEKSEGNADAVDTCRRALIAVIQYKGFSKDTADLPEYFSILNFLVGVGILEVFAPNLRYLETVELWQARIVAFRNHSAELRARSHQSVRRLWRLMSSRTLVMSDANGEPYLTGTDHCISTRREYRNFRASSCQSIGLI
jgi:hypothetical protein